MKNKPLVKTNTEVDESTHVPKLRTKLNFSLKQGMRPEAENGAPSWPGDSPGSHPVRECPQRFLATEEGQVSHLGQVPTCYARKPRRICENAHRPPTLPESGLCRPTKPAPVRRTSAQLTFISCPSSSFSEAREPKGPSFRFATRTDPRSERLSQLFFPQQPARFCGRSPPSPGPRKATCTP